MGGGDSEAGVRGTSTPKGFLLKGPGAIVGTRIKEGASRLHQTFRMIVNTGVVALRRMGTLDPTIGR